MFQTYGPRTNLRVDGAWKCGESIWEGVVGVGGFPKSEAQAGSGYWTGKALNSAIQAQRQVRIKYLPSPGPDPTYPQPLSLLPS